MVEEAQGNEAPVQRLADAVAGRFCYGVMAASAATFAFWSLYGVNAFPWVLESSLFGGGWVGGWERVSCMRSRSHAEVGTRALVHILCGEHARKNVTCLPCFQGGASVGHEKYVHNYQLLMRRLGGVCLV
jgi:hypothetical protein